MENDFVFNQSEGFRCMGSCANCPFFSRNRQHLSNYVSPFEYEMQAKDFIMNIPRTFFGYDYMGICHTQYEFLQNYLIEYCRRNYPWKKEIYMENNFGQVVLVSDNNTYEKQIKEIFKAAIDIAAEVTRDKNPQQSIMFDGIGLVLADDIKEAVRKVISILEKTTKMNGL